MFKLFFPNNNLIRYNSFNQINLFNSLIFSSKYFSASVKPNLKNKNNPLEIIQKILKENLKTEIDNYFPVNENQLKNILSESNFNLENKPNSKVILLEKNMDNKILKIIIVPKQPDFQADENISSESKTITPFYITIKNQNEKNGLFIEAVSLDTEFHITQINFSENIENLENKNFNFQKISKQNEKSLNEEYKGPRFYTLDETLKHSFYMMIKNLGVNEKIISAINVLSIDKDQELYLTWLKDLNRLI